MAENKSVISGEFDAFEANLPDFGKDPDETGGVLYVVAQGVKLD